MKLSRLRLLTLIAYILVAFAAPTEADSLSDTFTIAHKSLVLVSGTNLGSGFVVSSSSEDSVILTSAHTLGRVHNPTIYLNDSNSVGYPASILRISWTTDLALLSIKQGRMVSMILSPRVQEGEQIGVIGYSCPSFGIFAAHKELKPLMHESVVSSIGLGSAVIKYRAKTDCGNVGGPVLDVASGYYIGVVSHSLNKRSGVHEAIGPSPIRDFFKKSGLNLASMGYTGR